MLTPSPAQTSNLMYSTVRTNSLYSVKNVVSDAASSKAMIKPSSTTLITHNPQPATMVHDQVKTQLLKPPPLKIISNDDLMSDGALKRRGKAQHEQNVTTTEAMQILGGLDQMEERNINWTETNPGLTKALVEATFEDVAEEIEHPLET